MTSYKIGFSVVRPLCRSPYELWQILYRGLCGRPRWGCINPKINQISGEQAYDDLVMLEQFKIEKSNSAYRPSTDALQMKGQWESNINVWFPGMYSQKWNLLFPKQNYNVLSPSPYTHTYICERFIYFQDRSAYSAAGKYVNQSFGIYKSLTGTWMWILGLMPRNSQKRNT